MLCVLIKVLLHANAGGRGGGGGGRLKCLKFRTFFGGFSSDIMAVKGLIVCELASSTSRATGD